MLRTDTLCLLCKGYGMTNQPGPHMLAKLHRLCDEHYFNPKGTSLTTLLDEKKVIHTKKGLAYVPESFDTSLIEYE